MRLGGCPTVRVLQAWTAVILITLTDGQVERQNEMTTVDGFQEKRRETTVVHLGTHHETTTAGVQGGWPEGTYAIPMSKTGCPEVTDFTWDKGSRTHHTEMGSHASDPSHLAGIYTFKSDRVTQSFCIKVTPHSDGMHTWQKGRYCIMKYKHCPYGFRDGWLYWDDAAPWFGDTTQNQSGTLPDGEYNRNTKIMFCCRNDGLPGEPITLPTNSPFHLLRRGDRCQEVRGMSVNEEFVYWKDEPAMNMNTQGGLFPSVLRSKYPKKYTKVFYCYYTKAPPNNNLKTLITIGYVLAGVVGAIFFLLILICVIQRIANHKHKQLDDQNLSNAARERMLPTREPERLERPPPRTVIPEPTVEYRPPEYSEQGEDGTVSFQPEKKKIPFARAGEGDGASCSVAVVDSPTGDGPTSLGSLEERIPMLQPPAFDDSLTTPAQPGGAMNLPVRISQPPSYEEVLREDAKLPSIS